MPLTLDNMNPALISAQYAVRGPIVALADKIKAELETGKADGKYSFDSMIMCNIGNPQALRQAPLSFYREVLSLCVNPILVSDNVSIAKVKASGLYQEEAVDRAASYVGKIGHWTATGAYTASKGYPWARHTIADWIRRRDSGAKFPRDVHFEEITLTQGASPGIGSILTALRGSGSVMIPIPQYPLYSATLALQSIPPVPYYLSESNNWSCNVAELEKQYAAADIKPTAFVAINPGNPTGQVDDLDSIQGVIKFCHKYGLTLLADEVYQENIYAPGKKFYSYREALLSIDDPAVRNEVQIASFHSTSKGVIGECGRRGGYMHLMNFPDDVTAQIDKMQSIMLCPNVDGQIMTVLMVDPPTGSSKEQFEKEYNAVMDGYKRKADILEKGLNSIPGIRCNPAEGAMYLFPSLELSEQYIQHAISKGYKREAADACWATGLVEEKGVVVVPGSGFHQEPGTYHFRTTILPQEDQIERVVMDIATYQASIHEKFSDASAKM
eukprot:Tbor_TRINITY_DN5428_c0_g2::TRINITY_DN5428_c0_g2_i1::g.24077::m.24077/K00814/GPT, ALT; alanine transaminase